MPAGVNVIYRCDGRCGVHREADRGVFSESIPLRNERLHDIDVAEVPLPDGWTRLYAPLRLYCPTCSEQRERVGGAWRWKP